MHPNFLGALKVIHGRERKDQKKLLVLLIHRSKENEKKKKVFPRKKSTVQIYVNKALFLPLPLEYNNYYA